MLSDIKTNRPAKDKSGFGFNSCRAFCLFLHHFLYGSFELGIMAIDEIFRTVVNLDVWVQLGVLAEHATHVAADLPEEYRILACCPSAFPTIRLSWFLLQEHQSAYRFRIPCKPMGNRDRCCNHLSQIMTQDGFTHLLNGSRPTTFP